MNFKVQFEDGTWFSCGTYHNSKWNDMPKKNITQLVYKIGWKCIILEGYEEYNHIVERSRLLLKGKETITKVMLMVRKGNKVGRIILDLNSKKIIQNSTDFGKEYMGRPTLGWKKGIKNQQGKVKVA